MASPDEGAPAEGSASSILQPVLYLGQRTINALRHIGSLLFLFVDASTWLFRGMRGGRVRLGQAAIVSQVVRVGVRSIIIVSLVSGCIGLIRALQMAPPLDTYGQKDNIANIVGVAVLRELGPLIAAVVLTGFAGAAIAAELGTMAVGEEIEALEAHALNPIRFLVVPRVVAATISITLLGVIADAVTMADSTATAAMALDVSASTFWDHLLLQLKLVDFLTGVGKGAVFGLLIGIVACGNGLKVTGGAAGVGK